MMIEGDDREEIECPEDTPYGSIGIVISEFKDRKFRGTGCIFNKKYILTTANHCYLRNNKEHAKSVIFLPPRAPNEDPIEI